MLVSGTGIPSDTTVATKSSTTAFELSEATTDGSVTNGTLTFSGAVRNLTVGLGSALAAPKEMTLVAHCVPNYAKSAVSRNIFYRRGGATVTLETAADGTSYIKATVSDALGVSYTLNSNYIYTDGEIPLSIILVVDMNITKNHFKLFVNGVLADATDMQLGTAHNNTMADNDHHIYIGNDDNADNDAFNGKIEEVVLYNKALQVVSPKSGKFTFTKPLQELNINQTATGIKHRPQNYAARLFIKDYHNIRGTMTLDVASTSQISFDKANLSLSGA